MRATGGKSGRRLLIAAVGLLLLCVLLWFTVTSPGPTIAAPAAPDAQAVASGRAAYRQLRAAQGNRQGVPLTLGPADLSGLSAVASHGFRPDRLLLSVEAGQAVVRASHRLPFGRWLNLTLQAEGPSQGFPRVRLQVGIWELPPTLSRWALQVGRLYLRRRSDVPPLDEIVRSFKVEGATVSALVSLPAKSGVVNEMASAVAEPIDRASVLRIYCALSDAQRKKPSTDFAEQVRRAFSVDPAGAPRADFNRAAFVALAIFGVDEQVGDFAQITPADLGKCRMPGPPMAIYNRSDWPKHWALSAAIAVGAGTQLSEAAGEWKELADSLSGQPHIVIDDPSGFSMADLSADRAGFRTARAAWQADGADRMAQALARATPEQLLPAELVRREEALSNALFVKRYGGLDDPRFKQRVREIDAVIDAKGLH